MTKRILIFYISRYSGHFHAAEAIHKALVRTNHAAEIRMINAFDYTNPFLGRLINRAYIQVIKNTPDVWGNMYDNPEVLEKIRKVRGILHKYNMPKVRSLMESFRPDVVYCTQAYPCGMVADYKKTYNSGARLVGVLTDHAPHSYWLFDEVDFYVVPSEETATALARKGVPREKIKIYGIPIDSRFMFKGDKDTIRETNELSQAKRTILVMGGTQGLGAMNDIVDSLADKLDGHYQMIVVTGKNKDLYRRLRKKYSRYIGKGLKLYSYATNIEELMEVSDLIITKAGGITTAEALAKGLPLLIVNPIPGQERFNTDYLVKEGAAFEIANVADIQAMVDKLLGSENLLRKMSENAARLSKPDSALRIAELAANFP